jgi:hypothetical protein
MTKTITNEKQSKRKVVIIIVVIVLVLILASTIPVSLYFMNSSKMKTESGISAIDAWAIALKEMGKAWNSAVGLVDVKTDKINDDGTAEFWRFSCKSPANEELIAFVFVYSDERVEIQDENIYKSEFLNPMSCYANWSIDSTYAYPKALKDPVVKEYLSKHFTNNLHRIEVYPDFEQNTCYWVFEWNTYKKLDSNDVTIHINGETGETTFSEETS